MGSTKPTQRRYSQEQKDQAVRLVLQLQTETGQRHGAAQRVAAQFGLRGGVGALVGEAG